MTGSDAPATETRICADGTALAAAAADIVLDAIRSSSGAFRVALSGGSTPRALYTLLASRHRDPSSPPVPWASVHVFWGDERHVPPEDPESNYGMARAVFLSALPIPAANIHRIRGELPDAAAAAADYEAEIRAHFGLAEGVRPRFDLALLGLGTDGHTASLFPGTPAVEETTRLAVANRVEKLHADRITLTAPVFNEARRVLFLVSGGEKADIVRRVLEGPREPSLLPAQLVRPRRGLLMWLVDRAAAAKLRTGGKPGEASR